MSSKRERQRLTDIIENIDAIQSYIGAAGYDAFANDRKSIDATERCLERTAEAVVKIGVNRMEEIDPTLPVERVRGLGNVMRHAYDTIDLRLIYNLIFQNLPRLRIACEAALAN